MDGYETAEYIRGRERSARTPIIFLTAVSTDISQVLRGYEAGAVDYVLKPFDPVVLRSKVAVFAELERHRRGRERADELLRRAWESSPTGVVLVDDDGPDRPVEPGVRRGRRPRRAGGRLGPRRALPSRGPRGAGRALPAGARRAATPTSAELRLTAADGDEMPVAVVARPSATPTATCARSCSSGRGPPSPAAPPRPRSSARPPSAPRATRPRRSPGASRGSRRSPTASTRWCSTRSSRSCAAGCTRCSAPAGRPCGWSTPAAPSSPTPSAARPTLAGRALRQALADGRGAVELDDGTLAVPLRAGGELFGAVAVAGPNAATPPGQRGALVAHAAERAALIIRRALLLEREQHVASTLQHDLLPQTLPDLPGRQPRRALPRGRPRDRGRRRLVRRDPARRRSRRARRRRRRRARRRGGGAHGPAAQRRARVRARGPLAGGVRAADERLPPRPEPGRPHDDRLRGHRARPRPAALRQRRAPAAAARPRAAARRGCSRASRRRSASATCRSTRRPSSTSRPARRSSSTRTASIERRGEGVDIGLRRLLSAAGGSRDGLDALRERVVDSCLGPVERRRRRHGALRPRRARPRRRRAVHALPRPRGARRPAADAAPLARRGRRVARRRRRGDDGGQRGVGERDRARPRLRARSRSASRSSAAATRSSSRRTTWAARRRRESDPDRGRGLTLMQALMDEASFSFGGRYGGSVVLRRHLGAPREDAAARTGRSSAPRR